MFLTRSYFSSFLAPSGDQEVALSTAIDEIFKLFLALTQLFLNSLLFVNDCQCHYIEVNLCGEIKMASVMNMKKSSKIKCKINQNLLAEFQNLKL